MAALLDRRATPLMLGLLFGLFAVALGLMLGDNPAEQALFAARWTARAALPLFLVAYLANSLLRLWRGDITRALMRRRRQWGLGFALAHTIHLVALGINVLVFAPREPATVIAGGIAYGMIYLMALTSNDASMRAMGKWWKRMHSFGIPLHMADFHAQLCRPFYRWRRQPLCHRDSAGPRDVWCVGPAPLCALWS